MNSGPRQFGLKSLFVLTTCVAAFAATAAWVLDSDVERGAWQLPVLFYPNVGLLGLGLFAMPLLFVFAAIVSLVYVIASRPRSYAAWCFFGCVLLLVPVFSGPPAVNTKWILATGGTSLAFVVEVWVRGLPRRQLVAALAAVGAWACAYFFMLSAIVSAGI